MTKPFDIMASGISEEKFANPYAYAKAAIKALKAAGYAIVPVNPNMDQLNATAKAICIVSIDTAEQVYCKTQPISSEGRDGLIEYFWGKCLPDAEAAWKAIIKAAGE